jgi:hypothetical protein
MKRRLMRFPGAIRRDPRVEAWLQAHAGPLGDIARHWFEVMRGCGPDVTELLHDGQPTACIGEAAFAYVDAFASHVDVGFFLGAVLRDPHGLLEGTGKFMRHVKSRPGHEPDACAVTALVEAAYADMRRYLASRA